MQHVAPREPDRAESKRWLVDRGQRPAQAQPSSQPSARLRTVGVGAPDHPVDLAPLEVEDWSALELDMVVAGIDVDTVDDRNGQHAPTQRHLTRQIRGRHHSRTLVVISVKPGPACSAPPDCAEFVTQGGETITYCIRIMVLHQGHRRGTADRSQTR